MKYRLQKRYASVAGCVCALAITSIVIANTIPLTHDGTPVEPFKQSIRVAPGSGITSSNVTSAIGRWNGCAGAGVTFPQLVNATGNKVYNLIANDKLDTNLPAICGEVLSGTSIIEIYAWGRAPDGAPLECHRETVMAHEAGHLYHLANAVGCPSSFVMSTTLNVIQVSDESVPNYGYYWSMLNNPAADPAECQRVDGHWEDEQDDEEDPERPSSPLILDLDMDGEIATSNVRSYPVWFDIDGDGSAEETGWTIAGTQDAFLWVDLNGNGYVDGGRELFGDSSELPDGSRAADGFAALAVYDEPEFGGNGDGSITPADRIWRSLLLWTDSNHDGVSSQDEIRPVRTSHIRAISLKYVADGFVDGNGNVHLGVGTYWTTKGLGGHLQAYRVEDVVFRTR